MKITGIETLVCHARMRNWIFVKVVTDQPGLYGWGEATLEWHTRSVVGAVEDIAELLGRKCHLFLEVKSRPGWLDEKERFDAMGLDFKDGA